MKQNQIDIGQVQLGKRRFYRRVSRAFGFLVRHPHFRGHKQFFPRDQPFGNGAGDSLSHRLFIHVGRGGVNQAVARLDCVVSDFLTFGGVRNLKDAEPLQRHFRSVVQGYKFHLDNLRL